MNKSRPDKRRKPPVKGKTEDQGRSPRSTTPKTDGKPSSRPSSKPGSRPSTRPGAKPGSRSSAKPGGKKAFKPVKVQRPSRPKPSTRPDDGTVRLNRFIASAGVCSRREADTLISSGIVTVNGKVVTELGTRVLKTDSVKLGDEGLRMEKLFYVLLNKPKDYITTSKDPSNRKTVMELVRRSCKARIMPVGRLDRNTTGLLLFTNDGNLAKNLTHPSHGCEKMYHVFLDKAIKKTEIDKLTAGLNLEDGYMQADEASFVGSGKDKKQVGVKLHSGRNRIVRRMFEHLGYKVIKLDRVMFAGLTKKDIARGEWRHLTDLELRNLQKIG